MKSEIPSSTWTGLGLLIALVAGCGEPDRVLGNLCGQPECEYDSLTCQFYGPPNDAYRVFYQDRRHDGCLAMLVVDLCDLPDPSQLRLEGQSLAERVFLTGRVPQEHLDSVVWGLLEVFEGGLQAGATLRGQLVGRDPAGSRIEVAFDCLLEPALPE